MAGGSEYLTSNAYIAYPFHENTSGLARIVDPVHGAVATLPLGFLVDAIIMVPPTIDEVYLYSIVDQGASLYQFSFIDQYSNSVLQAGLDVSTIDVNSYYAVFTLENLVDGVLSKFVVGTTEFLAYMAGITLQDTYQLRLRLEERAINRRPPSIDTFELYTALPLIPEPTVPGPISGDVIVHGGYNVELPAAASETESDTTEIDMNAVASTGDGLVPCDAAAQSAYTKRFMHLVPDENGNIQLTPGAEDCYFIVPHESLQAYEVQGNCVACCSCDSYEYVAKAVKNLLDRSKAILTVLNNAYNNHYGPGVTHFNATIAPRYIGVKLQVNGMGGAEYEVSPMGMLSGGSLSGSVNWGNMGVSIQNNGDNPIQPTQLLVDMTTPTGYHIRQISWEYDGQGGQVPYVGDYTCDMTALPEIARGKRLSVSVGMYLPGGPAVTDPSWTGTITFSYSTIVGGVPVVATPLVDTVKFT